MAAITDIKISDPRLKKLVATAASGELSSSPGHASQLIAINPANQPGQTLTLNNKYSINYAIGRNDRVTLLNMQYDHKQQASDGTLHVFYEIRST